METRKKIATELFNYFASISKLPDWYYTNDDICEIMKSAMKEWEDAEPEDADFIIGNATDKIMWQFADALACYNGDAFSVDSEERIDEVINDFADGDMERLTPDDADFETFRSRLCIDSDFAPKAIYVAKKGCLVVCFERDM